MERFGTTDGLSTAELRIQELFNFRRHLATGLPHSLGPAASACRHKEKMPLSTQTAELY